MNATCVCKTKKRLELPLTPTNLIAYKLKDNKLVSIEVLAKCMICGNKVAVPSEQVAVVTKSCMYN